MGRLIAKATVQLPSYFIVYRPEEDEMNYHVKIDDLDVELRLVADEYGKFQKGRDEEYWTTGISEIEVSVARDEVEMPPQPAITERGGKDYTVQEKYFEKRLKEYTNVAVEAVNRVIRFFKFELRNALLQEISVHDNDFRNIEWFDETGEVVSYEGLYYFVQPVPGLHPPLNSKRFTRDEDANLQKALDIPIIPTLYEEILSDAQSAIFNNNLRRAVLELAIACEVMVKQKFFAEDSPLLKSSVGQVFELMEHRNKVPFSVVELISDVAERVFKRNFKADKPKDFKSIEHLFRCRNSVAHKGKLTYKNNNKKEIEVKRPVVIEWLYSVAALMEWVESLPS